MAERRIWPLHLGGFLGPFGGAMVTPMLTELSRGLHAPLSTVGWSMSAFLLAYAVVLLASGTLAESWGRRRTVRIAYIVYAIASVGCALAPNAELFILGRAAQGAANAFITPVLVAAIFDAVPRERLGRALGLFASMQGVGQAFAPLVGGVAAAFDYRWAFALTAVAAVGLAFFPPSVDERHPAGDVGRPDLSAVRALLNRRLLLACALAFGLNATLTGSQLLIGVVGADRFDLGPDARGLVLAAFGVAGLASGRLIGRAAEGRGARALGVAALCLVGVLAVAAGVTSAIWVLVAAVAGMGVGATASRIVINTLAVTSTPGNRAGATATALSWQFLGAALAPAIVLPLYAGTTLGSFIAAAVPSVAAGALLAIVLLASPRPRPAVSEGPVGDHG